MKTITIFVFLFVSIVLGCSNNPANKQIAAKQKTEDLKLDLLVQSDSNIVVTVTNTSKKNIEAYSHVETYERHYDYFSLDCETEDGKKFELNFLADRDKSASVIVKLAPGESFSHTINIEAWSRRDINVASLKAAGLKSLPDKFTMKAVYRNEPCTTCNDYYKSIWSGSVESEMVEYRKSKEKYQFSISIIEMVKGTHKHMEHIVTPQSVGVMLFPLNSNPVSMLYGKPLTESEADKMESFMKEFPLAELNDSYINESVEGEHHYEFVLQYGNLKRTITDSYYFQKDLTRLVKEVNKLLPGEYSIYFE